MDHSTDHGLSLEFLIGLRKGNLAQVLAFAVLQTEPKPHNDASPDSTRPTIPVRR